MVLGDTGFISFRQYFFLRSLLIKAGEPFDEYELENMSAKEATARINKLKYLGRFNYVKRKNTSRKGKGSV